MSDFRPHGQWSSSSPGLVTDRGAVWTDEGGAAARLLVFGLVYDPETGAYDLDPAGSAGWTADAAGGVMPTTAPDPSILTITRPDTGEITVIGGA